MGEIVETESKRSAESAARDMSWRGAFKSARRVGTAAATGVSIAALFTLLWDALADVLGTAATAALLRRAARRAAPRCPELTALAIAREKLEYHYTLPPAWADGAAGTTTALRALVAELRPLLVELTGPVVLRRLERIPELRTQGIIPPLEQEEDQS